MVAATRSLLSSVERSASCTEATIASQEVSSSARYSSSLPGKCWYRTGLLTPARSAMSSIAAAWYPCATKTSCAAASSCLRLAGFGSLFAAWRVWGVVTCVSNESSASPSPVVVLIEPHFPILLHGIGLVHVRGQVDGLGRQGVLPPVRLVDHLTLLLREIGRGRPQIALAHP